MTISANYKLLTTTREITDAQAFREAWKNPVIPYRQWTAFEQERILAAEGKAERVAPFKAFLDAAHYINNRELGESMDLLDVGAASGYYGELIRIYGPEWYYTACDFNPAFQEIAKKYLPRIRYDIADARDLPYANKTFDVVMADVCATHLFDWRSIVSEAARVASKYVILNRVFIVNDGPTKLFQKTAYDIPVIELWISRAELTTELSVSKIEIIKEFMVHPDYPQITFVCAKQ